jgi:hypothetical protein
LAIRRERALIGMLGNHFQSTAIDHAEKLGGGLRYGKDDALQTGHLFSSAGPIGGQDSSELPAPNADPSLVGESEDAGTVAELERVTAGGSAHDTAFVLAQRKTLGEMV